MDFSFTALDGDGTLHNPIVVASLVIWCMLIAFVGIASGIAAAQKNHYTRNRVILLATLVLVEPFAVRIIGALAYIAPAHQSMSVGFWGTPPIWIPFAVAASCGTLGYISTKLRARPLVA